MADKNSAVFGVYSTPAALEAALEALRAKGFRNTDISVLSVPHPAFPVMTPGIPTPAAPAAPSAASSVGGALG